MSKKATTEKIILQCVEALDTSNKDKLSEKKSRQPDSYWSWIVCAVGFISIIIVQGSAFCFGLIFPHLLDEFERGKSNTGRYIVVASNPSDLFVSRETLQQKTSFNRLYQAVARPWARTTHVIVIFNNYSLKSRCIVAKYSHSHYSPRLKRIIVLVYTHESLRIDLCRIFKHGNSQVDHFGNNSVMA